MAVATARRVRADRAVKGRISQKFGHGPAGAVRKMSFKLPPQLGDAGEQLLMDSPNQVDEYQIPAARESTLKKRKAAKGKSSADLRRSSSTPHLRGPSSGDSGPLSPNSDKRRNKLGYHRTSVACDQAGPLESQPKNNSKKEETSNAPSNSSHSSPRPHSQSQTGSISEIPGLTQSPQPESEIGSGSELPGYGGSSENGVNYVAVPAIFSTPGPAWGAPPVPMHQAHSQPRQLQDDPQSPYWSTPVTSTFPSEPVFGQIDAAAANFVNPNYSYHQPQTWAPPSRSLSYSEIQGQGHQYPYNEAHPQYSQHSVAPAYHFSPSHQLNHATFSSPDRSRAMVAPNAAWNHPSSIQQGYEPSEQQVPVQSVLRSTWYPPAPSYPGVDEKPHPSPHPPSHYYTHVSNPG
ncbi:hypothetical protein EG328_009057 [Venturia inaequalis]|uniref:Uncharacterized protein n=1 Tax=Venturia inaequalis TaxID=5025 RepID=A0A8H3VAM2_VENIN|nr:hypothetical protein EG328_009057 [Venturia inaequalis]KAE9994146.1 hypothetical protein EG327_001218 [Venturia inaequalis]